ncbi:MAG: HNH endonuclease [Octadecabacter sp.]|nr:HNH endonuclease [Octadecabacter sp.]
MSLSEIKTHIEYCPETGEFRWLKSGCGRRGGPGSLVGTPSWINKQTKQCIHLFVLGERWKAHRLAWYIMTGERPTFYIDHINNDPFDNRWNNLRKADASTNAMNRPGDRGRSLPKNVYVCGDKFRVRVMADGRRVNGGRYATVELADAMAQRLRKSLHGEFSCDIEHRQQNIKA